MNYKSVLLVVAGIIALLAILIVIQIVIGMVIFLVKIGVIGAVLLGIAYAAYYLWNLRS